MRGLAFVASALVLLGAAPASAAPPSMTESCTKAAENGQRSRMDGKLRDAQQHFLACSSNCPPIIEADCTKWGAQIREVIPTVVIDARDADGRDIDGEVDVLIDDQIVTHTIDGKGIPVDPGSHVIVVRKGRARGKESIVAKEGMKSRVVTIKVIDNAPINVLTPASSETKKEAPAGSSSSSSGHSALPWVVFGLGSVFAIGGVIVLVTAPALPAGCNGSTKECGYLDPRTSETPGAGQIAPTQAQKADLADRQDAAGRSTTMPVIGIGLIVAGSVIAAGGLLWHFLEPTGPSSPAVAFDGTGIRGRF
jgi:hypothetical protein